MTVALLLCIVFGFMVFVIMRSHVKTARLSRLDWNDLVARIQPVAISGISLVALDYLGPVKGQLQIGGVDLWCNVGGDEGIRRMYANAEILIALAGYTHRWNPLESVVVVERMRRDAIALRRATLRLAPAIYMCVGMVLVHSMFMRRRRRIT